MPRTPSDDGARLELALLRDTPPWEWPENTDARLLEILSEKEASEADRLIAADLAGDFTVINDALAEKLLSIVGGARESDALRAMAAISLGPALEQADIEGFDDLDAVPISEQTFNTIRKTLRELYMDTGTPRMVRRLILEASVRAPEDWHEEAIRAAVASNDREWLQTAVFCMGHVRGFDSEIVEALDNPDPDIQLEAVRAAGNWEVEAAEPRIVQLVTAKGTEKSLLIAAIEAAGYICGERAPEILSELTLSTDEDIAEAATEALLFAENFDDDDFDIDDESDDDDEDGPGEERVH